MSLRQYASFKVTVEDLFIVTHAVPPERVRPHVPHEFELDTIEIPASGEAALVSAACFFNRNAHWAPLQEPSLDYHQATYRTYVKRRGEAAVFFLGTYIEGGLPFVAQRLAIGNAWEADFDVSIAYDPHRRAYRRYYCRAASDHGTTVVEAKAPGPEPDTHAPFDTGRQMSFFITHRLVGYFRMPGGVLGSMRVEHEEMNPVEGWLITAQFDLWERLGILTRREFMRHYAVLVQPRTEFVAYPPSPVL